MGGNRVPGDRRAGAIHTIACAAWMLALGAATAAQTSAASILAQVSGTFGGAAPDGATVKVTFACLGSPTCIGTYVVTVHDPLCTNLLSNAGNVTISGFELANPGTIQGSILLQGIAQTSGTNPDGTCTVTGTRDKTLPYTGTWDGSNGTLTVTNVHSGGATDTLPGTFSAKLPSTAPATPPPFPMVVTINVTATTATASAQIQYAPPDVGKTGSVFVFALAPRGLVKSAAATKDDASACVLAQLDPATGQLHAASAAGLQPYTTGVLSAQGQSVSVLNGVSTPTIAGATFFVGYGTDSASMISQGVNRNVVAVPGTAQCPDVVAATPGALSGLWWAGAAENGWGIDFTQRRNVLFGAWYTYDAGGAPRWYVATNCAMAAGAATSGSCSGSLYEVKGTGFFGVPFDPSAVSATAAGTLQVNFQSPSAASMTFTVAGVTRTVPIVRQVFRSGTTAPAVDFTDLWWNPGESGWGVAISHQFDVMFLAWFVYDAGGKPTWYVATNCTISTAGNGCAGDLYQTSGPPFGPTFDPSRVKAAAVGSVSVTFTDPNNGILNYTIGGVSASKAITRQIF